MPATRIYPFNMLPENVLLSTDIAADLTAFLARKRYSQVMVLTDENTHKHCYSRIATALPAHTVITVPSGEEQKNIQTCVHIWQAMTDKALDRHAVAIVLGGGVMGDMGGFCAATYKRGISFILIPTTLLAQADASIGGKLGVDFNHFKNHIGVFQLPDLTLLHSGFLQTLPQGELRSGFAEVIKHTLISDQAMWEQIRTKTLAQQDWNTLIRHSAEFKAGVVQEDPKEAGLRKILNAGHTIGHALESYLLANNRRILHGEAVAAGIIAEAWIAAERKMISEETLRQISVYILSVYGKVVFGEDELEAIAALTLQDKKNKGNRVLCVLLDGVGRARWDCEISLEEVKRALSFYLAVSDVVNF
jgi:3-dehydroquinate synthase